CDDVADGLVLDVARDRDDRVRAAVGPLVKVEYVTAPKRLEALFGPGDGAPQGMPRTPDRFTDKVVEVLRGLVAHHCDLFADDRLFRLDLLRIEDGVRIQ